MRRESTGVDGGWVRASRCTPGNNCVELRFGRAAVSVRDSKNVDSDVLTFTRDGWICFLGRTVR
jgi:hypothetical protein